MKRNENITLPLNNAHTSVEPPGSHGKRCVVESNIIGVKVMINNTTELRFVSAAMEPLIADSSKMSFV
jgi:hypothetical protein